MPSPLRLARTLSVVFATLLLVNAPAEAQSRGMRERELEKFAASTHQRCMRADLEACAVVGRMHIPLPSDDSTLAALPAKRRNPRLMVSPLTAACDAGGSAVSCVRLGKALQGTTKSSKWHEPNGALARLEQGCERGVGDGCVARAEASGDWAVKGHWWEKGCKLGAASGCLMAGHLYAGDFAGITRIVPVDSVKAIAMLDAGCQLGDKASCLKAGPLLLAGATGAAADTARAIPILDESCANYLVAASCMSLGELMVSRGELPTARKSFDRACLANHAAACERLAALATADALPGSAAAEEALARAATARAVAAFGPIATMAGKTYLYATKDQRYAFRMAVEVLQDGRALVLDEGLTAGRGLMLIAVPGGAEYRVTNQLEPDKLPTANTYRARKLADGTILVWGGNRGYQYAAQPAMNRIRKQPVIIGADGSIRGGMEGARQTPGNDGWWSDYHPSSQEAYVAAAALGQQRQAEVKAQQGRGAALLGAAVGAAAGAYVGADAATTTQMMAAGAAAVDPTSAISRGLSTASSGTSGAGASGGVAGGAAGGQGGGPGAVQPGSYPTRPMVAGLAAACPGFTEDNYRTHAQNGGSDQQLFALCGQAYEYYWMYKNAIRKGFAEHDANRTYDAHAKSAAVAIDFAKGG